MIDNQSLLIMNKLIGPMDGAMADSILKNIDCFLHPDVSLFIPACGQCAYAITPRHTHPAYSFVYYFHPTNGFIIGDELTMHELSDGKCLCAISPDVVHQELPDEDFQSYIAIMIDKPFLEAAAADYGCAIPVFEGEVYKPHPELLGLLRCFMLSVSEPARESRALLNSLAVSIAHFILKSTLPQDDLSIPLFDRFEVDRAITYMNSHFAEKITIEELAGVASLSARHFARVFKAITGSSPIDFLNIIRLQRARHMLVHNDISITEVALLCGFKTSSYFSNCFVEKYKLTPSAYRQQFKRL